MRRRHAATRSLAVWGSGTPRREFLHVDDLADAAAFVMESSVVDGVFNVGVGEDLTIRDLAQMVCRVVGFEGELVFDATKPDGTPRKLLDVSKLGQMGWTASIAARRRHPRDVCGLSRTPCGAFTDGGRGMSTHLNADMRGSTSREDKKMTASVTIFHNVVWSRHKGAVLSALHNISGSGSINYSMVQIADTEHDRLGFSDVDYSFHRYPMKKLYNGCYEDVPTWRMTARLTWEVLKAKSDLVVLPGYHRPEYWGMMVACILTGKRRAVFCDSTGRDRPRRMLTSIPKRVFFSLCDGYFGFGTRSREYLMSLGAKQEKIFIPCQAAALPRSFSPETAIPDRVHYRAGQCAGVPVRRAAFGREGHRHACSMRSRA